MTAKIVAVGLAVMLTTVGGAAALTGGPMAQTGSADTVPAGEADVDASYDNGTVTVTVTRGGVAVENATVEVGDGEYGTDANGTVVAEVDVEDELGIEVEADGFEGDVEYELDDGALTIAEEEYEYDTGSEESEDDEHASASPSEHGDDERAEMSEEAEDEVQEHTEMDEEDDEADEYGEADAERNEEDADDADDD